MEKIEIKDLDIREYLKTDEDMVELLQAALEEPDPGIFISALNAVARLKGVGQLAKNAGVGRSSLYKSLAADANPRFETVVKVTRALGLALELKPGPAMPRR